MLTMYDGSLEFRILAYFSRQIFLNTRMKKINRQIWYFSGLKFFKFGIDILVFLSSNAKLLRNRKKNVRFDKQCLNFWLLPWRNKSIFREKKAFFPCDFFYIPSHRHLYGFLLSQKNDHTNGGDHINGDHTNDGW